MKKNKNITQLPNILTMLRFALALGIVILFGSWLYKPTLKIWMPIFIMFFTGAISDILDGYIARRYNIKSNFGKIMDPIADKALINTTMLVLLVITSISGITKLVPILFIAISLMLIRDVAVDSIKIFLALSARPKISANKAGKVKTIVQFIAILFALVGVAFPNVQIKIDYILILFITATCLSLYSGIVYINEAFKNKY